MWRLQRSSLGADTERWQLLSTAGRAAPFAAVVSRWATDTDFRAFWAASLSSRTFDAYAWECPPVTAETASRPFECVFVSSPALSRIQPEPEAFAEHFRDGESVVTFPNLGGDAILVAPGPGGSGTDFTHLASFVATATPEHADSLWQAVGEAMTKRIGAMPVWLSTAGLGVGWLHVRLDDRPKYYRHAAYRRG